MLGVNELKEIAIKCGTPSYIFDTDELCARIDAMQQILGCGVTVCYAMKANPFLISVLDKKLDKFEVCSPGEFAICEKEGINREKIVLSGVNKEKKDILYTMLESTQWNRLTSLNLSIHVQLSVALRLRFL